MTVRIINADAMDGLRSCPDESVHCVVTSPPYWGLRDYGVAGQIGLERTLAEHIVKLVEVFREVRRVLRPDGTLWLNYGDAYNNEALTRNARDVWTIATVPFTEAHFATFPPELAERCIKAGCPAGGTVLDPFGGAGTTGLVADRLQRNAILIELNPEYADMARRRLTKDAPLLAEVQS